MGQLLLVKYISFGQANQTFDGGKIVVKNACAVDLTGIQQNQQPIDRYYFTATEFIDNSAAIAWDWTIDGTKYFTKIVNHSFPPNSGPNTVSFSLIRTTASGAQPPINGVINVLKTPKPSVILSQYDEIEKTECTSYDLMAYQTGAEPSGVTYKWYPYGEITNKITAKVSDLYTVRVTDANGCYTDASVIAKICSVGNANNNNLSQNRSAVSHFIMGNGIDRVANFGSSEQPSKYPVDFPVYNSQSFFNGKEALSSFNNPNLFHQKRYLYSTDGDKIINSQGAIIKSAGSPSQDFSETVIVPQIMDFEGKQASTESYIFQINVSNGNLSYIKLDSRPGGNPLTGNEQDFSVVINSELLSNDQLAPKIAVSKFIVDNVVFDKSGYHVVFTNLDGSKFYRYFLNRKGLTGPYVSTIPNSIGSSNSTRNQLKFNHKGDKIYNANGTVLQELNFDNNSGNITFSKIINIPAKGFELSSNDNYIFYTNGSTLSRYDFRNDKSIIIDDDPNGNFGDLKSFRTANELDEILVATNNSTRMGSIINANFPVENINAIYPDRFPAGKKDSILNHIREKLILYKRELYPLANGTSSSYTLNNYTELPEFNNASSQNNLKITGKKCVKSNLTFEGTPVCDLPNENISYEWNFGDGTATKPGQKVTHAYQNSGTYKVKLIITLCGTAFIVESSIKVEPAPEIDDSPILHCYKLNPSLEVNAKILNLATDFINPGRNQLPVSSPADQLRYIWAGNTIDIPASLDKNKVDGKKDNYGDVKVKVGFLPITGIVNSGGSTSNDYCETEVTIPILKDCPPELVVPNIFTPNGDNNNDFVNYVKVDIEPNSLMFKIYNRWGELMYFADDDSDDPWDGTFNGKKLQSDTYAWIATFKKVGDITKKTYRTQGAILLIR